MIRSRLGVMMFLQYAIWGAWAPVLWRELTGLGFAQSEVGWIFSLLWLACMLAPLTGGQVADRWVATERVLGVAHLAGGILLLTLQRSPTRFSTWIVLMGAYSICYAPTLALTNSLALRHLPSDRSFGAVRVWGTIGWIASGLALTALRSGWLGPAAQHMSCDEIALAGVLSIVMGLFCFTLPHTPPIRESREPLAIRKALALLRDRNTLAFMVIAFIVTTELQFYYGPTASYLEGALGFDRANVPAVMSVAQAAEILAMAFALPIALDRLGLRKTLVLGTIAWPLRYAVFAAAPLGALSLMRPLVVGSLTLHGIGYTFFFVASQIFIDRVAPKDIRSSAQSLLTFATLGLGNFLGTLFTATIMERYTQAGATNWPAVFVVPCVLTVGCAIAFSALVREPQLTP